MLETKSPYRYQILEIITVLKLSTLVLVGWCIAVPAHAGLFADDDARKRIQVLEERSKALEARVIKLEELLNRQTKSMLDLQGQIDVLNNDIRKLRGQNEELAHGLQDAEKRSKDFYVDLDSRLRHFESAEEAAKEAAEKAAKESASANLGKIAAPVSNDPNDPAVENRAFESAYALYKSGSNAKAVKAFQDFLNKYPDSMHVPNAKFWLADSLYKLNNYKDALDIYQDLLKTFPGTPKAPDVMFNIASCQRQLKLIQGSKKTLKQLVAKYPRSEAATKAKKLLSSN
ncbi:MAG: tol-pal system protein YbgF [Gallionella sp.]